MNRVAALRVSLLVAMGIVPVACGGNTAQHATNESGEPQGGGGSSGNAGIGGRHPTPSTGGTLVSTVGGTASVGTAGGGGGAPIVGGEGGGTGYRCSAPQLDPKTGLVSCSEGFAHRPTSARCEGGTSTFLGGAGAGGEGGTAGQADPGLLPRVKDFVDCVDDESVCNAYQFGYCARSFVERSCASGCITDADCGAGSVCVCDQPASPTGGECVPASCETDLDCGDRSLCASYSSCDTTAFSCLTPLDECTTDTDCPRGELCVPQFEVDGDPKSSRRVCDSISCGRPFLVEKQARVAPLAHEGKWRTAKPLAPRVAHLTIAERAARAAHFSHLGQLEHASIAAFARFSLQLLALGAPAELVEACTQALADETEHAKLCFELASAYAGRAVGPGLLDVNGSLATTELVDVLELVLVEGCFGETGAALEALEAAEGAADPVISGVYARIAADEQRHAELAFRFVRWAVARGGPAAVERIRAALAEPPAASAATYEVTLPCLRALLEAFTHSAQHSPTLIEMSVG